MAKNVVIRGNTYSDCPEVDIPQAGGGTAKFHDTSDATLDNGNKMLSGNSAYADGVKYTGTIPSKSAQTYTPTTSDQTIAAGQYLSGAQTVKGDQNLVASNIRKDVTMFGVTGSLDVPVVSQDSTTKILSIS